MDKEYDPSISITRLWQMWEEQRERIKQLEGAMLKIKEAAKYDVAMEQFWHCLKDAFEEEDSHGVD